MEKISRTLTKRLPNTEMSETSELAGMLKALLEALETELLLFVNKLLADVRVWHKQ